MVTLLEGPKPFSGNKGCGISGRFARKGEPGGDATEAGTNRDSNDSVIW